MKIVDAAANLYLDLGSPADITVPFIAAYYRNNIGDLNVLLNTDYMVNSTSLELNNSGGVEITDEEISIFDLMFEIRYYTRQARNFLGVGGVDQLISAESDGGKLTFVNKNTVAQNYIKLKNDAEAQLKKAINSYKTNSYRPLSQEGDDTAVVQTSLRIAPNLIVGQTDVVIR